MKKAERHIQRAIELMDAVSLTKRDTSFGASGESTLKNEIYEDYLMSKKVRVSKNYLWQLAL